MDIFRSRTRPKGGRRRRRRGLLRIFRIPCSEKKRTFGVSMRFEFLPVGVGAFDDPETIRFLLRIGVSMRLNILPVGTGVLDGPKNERIFNLQPAIICSRIKSKICCFSDRRGRRSLQGLMVIGRKSVVTKFTVTSILDRRGDHWSSV